MSTPKPRASSGTMITPPPSPVSAPRKPAAVDPSATSRVNARTLITPVPRIGRLIGQRITAPGSARIGIDPGGRGLPVVRPGEPDLRPRPQERPAPGRELNGDRLSAALDPEQRPVADAADAVAVALPA